ncbi:MAG: asparaginase [SAR86 cluster bacterium]|uniref:Asparaginase n=1 Tax=SAR86 cluster bacterium TaxID=2030880 RepID=A0A2A4WZN6_9GAMM|nr:MAG: asparaginase [SAR86 cluster bacterium]
MSVIRIFTAGGTIDKIYFDAKSSYEVGPPNITEVLSGLNLSVVYEVVSLMQKDSLEMTDADREAIHHAVSETIEDMIIITHGTDTMTNTAKVLSDIPNKTIVLTGALSPALFKNSDAMFNIGAALTAAQTKHAGVYIAMNGVIFDHDKVRKDVENNRFVAL